MVIFSVGHGTLPATAFLELLQRAQIHALVDVRTAPGSRRHPHFGRALMAEWLPQGGIRYRWEQALGGWRKAARDSPNTALRNESFRGYADYMATPEFQAALGGLLAEAATTSPAFMCSESLWWRCHRRLIADACVLLGGMEVNHLMHDGRLERHSLTDSAQRHGEVVRYQTICPVTGG